MTQVLFNTLTVPYEPSGTVLKNFTGTVKTLQILFHWLQEVKKEVYIFPWVIWIAKELSPIIRLTEKQ